MERITCLSVHHHSLLNCSPVAFIKHQRGWEDEALDPELEAAGHQEEQRVPVPGRGQRGGPGHDQGLDQGGGERGQPLRHPGELGTRELITNQDI